MKILAIDTSTRAGSVALLEDETAVAELQVSSSETHAKRLMTVIDGTLDLAGLGLEALDAFAVTRGPGSFTGLRIGISAVKGFAFATGKPVAGVSTLDALAHPFSWFPGLICPLLDARKGEVYAALYRGGARGSLEKVVSDCAVRPKDWLEGLEGACLFVGDGAVAYGAMIEEVVGRRATFAPFYLQAPRASVVGALGLEQIKRGETCDASALVPLYIRKSDAEIKLSQGKLG
ncbi:MAG: tRNA (adenosine(37)-N6)-threonylcarbamoyltransferase complex dimerization subunit type 1 TsaB [Thermodesulfobacteriota bacterium]|nr:tRNA (adenosine(37)-N6)-threonylcarbamoyltransferase complex dimerization subunit type 1 TsaB [Thermodesulfobacteriota bacterium]